MSGPFDVYRLNFFSYEISGLLATTFLKGCLVFAVVRLVVMGARRISPVHKHLLWFFTVGAFLLIPLLSLLAPQFRIVDVPLINRKKEAIVRFIEAVSPQIGYPASPVEYPPVGQVSSSTVALWPLPRLSWAFWVSSVWAAGVVWSLSRVLSGLLRVAKLLNEAHLPKVSHVHFILHQLIETSGVHREVRVLMSERSPIPFACNALKPVIVLPSTAARWPKGRLRAVLTHELAHVRRMDYLTRLLSRVVCALLWFVPFVWISHANLHIEQERACDALTVRAGTEPSRYAEYLVELARVFTQRDPLCAGIFLSRVSRSDLEKRIVTILGMSGETLRTRLVHFLRPLGICFLCSLPLLFLDPVFGEIGTKPVKREVAFKRFVGTWVNQTYGWNGTDIQGPQKLVIGPDDEVVVWTDVENPAPCGQSKVEIAKSWIAIDGFLYCEVRMVSQTQNLSSYTELWRLNQSGSVWESMWRWGNQKEFPPAIDVTSYSRSLGYYKVFYRE